MTDKKLILDKKEIIKEFGINEIDTGSPEVQIALLSSRINHLTNHLKNHKKDFHSRRGLIALTARRRKLLDFLKNKDFSRYTNTLKKLNLRK